MLGHLERACGGPRQALALLAILAIGLGLRLDYAVDPPNAPVDDARAYARIARALHAGEGFTQGDGPGYRHLQSASNYAPGLPLLTAAIYEARGEDDETAARVILALLGSLAVPLAFFLGKRLGGPAAGLVASVPTAVLPALLEYGGMLMTEPVGAALLAAAILAWLRAGESPRLLASAATGLLLGGLAMLRPEYLVLLLLLPALALWERRRQRPLNPRMLAPPALMLAAACLVLAPWTVRNFVTFDRLVPVSTGGGQLLYEGSYMRAGPDPERFTPVFLDEHPWIGRKLGPRPGPIYRGQAVAELAARRHPGEEPDTALRRMGLEAYGDALGEDPLELGGFLGGKIWLAWTAPARDVMEKPFWRGFQLVLLLAALIGLAVGLARRRREAVVIATVFLAVTLMQAVFIASPRRTLLLAPEISALAGFGLVWLVARVRGGRESRLRHG
jgi:4-amino-4-deoxy-L-arabinose transferase-like glycosyltransferase